MLALFEKSFQTPSTLGISKLLKWKYGNIKHAEVLAFIEKLHFREWALYKHIRAIAGIFLHSGLHILHRK